MVVDTGSDWVRIVKPVKARISTYQDGDWVESGTMTIPAGWYAGPGAKK